ncbi:hypothetical protein IB276_11630 [Ensifer sp. ENS04]|uniref:hypothetical protein n=1 Tax=Ensifer sp. ENS04 TaxID=2769281 RepID=UPI001782724D|nr:hypothetical protein [Ensifer sp. ENS04]MBD9540104.1 hypothetical protein [Ensifer sp. ENS04]
MPILVDDRQMNSALQLAAQRPFEGVDPGFGARLAADWSAMREFSNSNADHRNALAAQNDFQVRFFQESGQRLPGWVDSMNANAEEVSRKQFDAWKTANPDSDLTFPTREEFRAAADAKAREARHASDALSRRSTSASSAIGGFLGTAAGAMTDPVNLLASGFGASASAGILRTALTEAGIGAASESLIQGSTFDRKQRLDPNFSVEDALMEIGAAGAGGAVLGGGIKGLASIWHRAKTGEWPSHVRDTANVVTREAALPESRFAKSVQGESAHRAAVSKAIDDLSASRPVELPPEAFTQANARPGRVYDADGNNIGVRYELAEASDLITSHNDDLSTNPAFPPELQPRDRSRALSQDQIAGIAANLQPERLGFSPQAESGAPIVGPDGLVESGNGRVLALRRAYNQAGVPAENYRNFLRSQNFDIDGMTNPVLIARRVTDLEDQARVGFVTAANRSTAMKLGAAEQALSDARLLDSALLDSLDGSDIKAAGNQPFARGFMSKLPRSEQGSLIDKDGFLSQDGERRITAALMGRAYGEPTLLGRALEDTDNNIKAIAGAMADSSAPWAKMRDAVARGEIPAGMDITDDLLNAVRLVMKARDEGRTVRDLVNQAEMFGGPDELSKIMARAMFSDMDLRRPVGRARLAEFLKDYADEAMKNDAGPRLFGDALEASDILKSSLERTGRNDLLRVAEERLTPEAVDKLAEDPMTAEASIMDAQRLRAERSGIKVDLGDGLGERSLDDILDEADDEIAAAHEIEACTIGREQTQ